MYRAAFLVALVLFCQHASLSQAASDRAATNGAAPASADQVAPEVFARRMIALTDSVISTHVEPPSRQEMILAAARTLVPDGGTPTPAALSEQISRLADPAELKRLLGDLWGKAQESADRPDEERQMAAIDAVCRTIPGRPQVISAAERRVQQQLSANRYVGIGIQLAMHGGEKLATIVKPFPGGAARRAGAKAGDLIVEVDGVATEGRSLGEVVQMLRGEAGSAVSVGVRQPDSQELRKLDMVRAEVPIESVHGFRRRADDSWSFQVDSDVPVAYVKLVSITASTPHELRAAARAIAAFHPRGVIVDLRDHLGAATIENFRFVADELLGEVLVGRIRDAAGQTREYHSGPDSLFGKLPMIVLTNRDTRGDPEFLAAALQDAGRTVVGEPTAGDAYVRRMIDLPDGLGGIVLRSGVWERPSGRSLLRSGVGDDGVAPPPRRDLHAPDRAAAPGGIQPDSVMVLSPESWNKWVSSRGIERTDEKPDDKPLDATDPQLAKAVELVGTL